MKRKLTLVFNDDKLLHATIIDRGKRVKLPAIITSNDALKEVKDAIQRVLVTLDKCETETSKVGPVTPPISEWFTQLPPPLSEVSPPPAVVTPVSTTPITPTIVGSAITADNLATTIPPAIITTAATTYEEPKLATTIASSEEALTRSRSVCARPKSPTTVATKS